MAPPSCKLAWAVERCVANPQGVEALIWHDWCLNKQPQPKNGGELMKIKSKTRIRAGKATKKKKK
jgi:hypothetical protein